MTEKGQGFGGIHRAWIVLIGCVLFQAGSVGLLTNSTNVFFTALKDLIPLSIDHITMYYSIRTLASALSVRYMTALFYRLGLKKHIYVTMIMLIINTLLMNVVDNQWSLYINAIVSGVFMSTLSVPVPIIINNWFNEKRGLALGLAVSSSGLAAAICSPLFSMVIIKYGFTWAVYLLVILVTLFTIIPTIFLLVYAPKDVGTTPFGKPLTSTVDLKDERIPDVSKIRRTMTYVCAMSIICISTFNNYLPMYATSLGYSLTAGSLINSCSMFSNVSGKLIYGTLLDKVGTKRSIRVFLFIILLSMFGFVYFNDSLLGIGLSALIYGLIFSLAATISSNLCLDVFSINGYKDNIGTIMALTSFSAAGFSFLVSSVYRWLNQLQFIFILGIVLVLISLFSLEFVYPKEPMESH